MNILTFDIEEWYLEKYYFGNRLKQYAGFDEYLDRILELLDKKGLNATFFCVGGMGEDFPEVVRRIDQRGHEVGCHSFKHVWLSELNRAELIEDTKRAVDSLQQCLGKKIISYRAPAFSIGEGNKWAFEILSECGIERDASVFPAARDFGGFSEFGQSHPSIIKYCGAEIKEFPIRTTTIMGHQLAYSGGGYFRFFPYRFVKREMAKSDYSMTYFHIADLVPDSSGMLGKKEFEAYFKIPGTLKNRYVRYFKSNIGKGEAMKKLEKLIESNLFINLSQADKLIDWGKAPVVTL